MYLSLVGGLLLINHLVFNRQLGFMLLTRSNLNNNKFYIYINKICYHPYNNNKVVLLAAAPLVQSLIPVMVSADIISQLAKAMNIIHDSINSMNDSDGYKQLSLLQQHFSSFDNILKDQCALANGQISGSSARSFYYTPEYHDKYL